MWVKFLFCACNKSNWISPNQESTMWSEGIESVENPPLDEDGAHLRRNKRREMRCPQEFERNHRANAIPQELQYKKPRHETPKLIVKRDGVKVMIRIHNLNQCFRRNPVGEDEKIPESPKNPLPTDYKAVDKHFVMSRVGSVRHDVALCGAPSTTNLNPTGKYNMDFLFEAPIVLVSHCINERDRLGEDHGKEQTQELITTKNFLDIAQATHLIAKEKQIAIVVAKYKESEERKKEIKHVNQEIEGLNREVALGRDLILRLETSSSLLKGLKLELEAIRALEFKSGAALTEAEDGLWKAMDQLELAKIEDVKAVTSKVSLWSDAMIANHDTIERAVGAQSEVNESMAKSHGALNKNHLTNEYLNETFEENAKSFLCEHIKSMSVENRAKIDTALPFESVKQAVNMIRGVEEREKGVADEENAAWKTQLEVVQGQYASIVEDLDIENGGGTCGALGSDSQVFRLKAQKVDFSSKSGIPKSNNPKSAWS
eukprot:Gb_14841 [translate_table: standard]